MRLVLLAVLATGCVSNQGGWIHAVSIGPGIALREDDATTVIAALEVTPFVQSDFSSRGRAIGIGATAAAGGAASRDGATGFAAVGFEYLPFLYETGLFVGFGAHLAYNLGEARGLGLVAPRLSVSIPVGTLAGAPLGVGALFRCHIGIDDGASLGCGPALIVTRVALGD